MISKLKIKIKELLSLKEAPRKTALAFSIGVFIAFSPILGFHTLMVILVAWLFRLNPVALILGAFVNNPWTFAPLYGGSLWFGVYLYGGVSSFPQVSWQHLTFLSFVENLKPYIAPFFLGTTLLGVFFGVISYFITYYFILQFRKSRISPEN
ncbi:MAG: DUF2062 domain-containing protein [Nitrospiria bacterium]